MIWSHMFISKASYNRDIVGTLLCILDSAKRRDMGFGLGRAVLGNLTLVPYRMHREHKSIIFSPVSRSPGLLGSIALLNKLLRKRFHGQAVAIRLYATVVCELLRYVPPRINDAVIFLRLSPPITAAPSVEYKSRAGRTCSLIRMQARRVQ